jgi:RNA polymerase sigma factor (sigma-70 family)
MNASADDDAHVEQRLNELLDAYGSFLRKTIRRLCPTTLGVTAEEIEQDARIRLWHALHRERNITDPASYLYRIAATAAIDAVRRVRARRESGLTILEPGDEAEGPIEPPSPDRSPEALASDRETASRIHATMRRLSDNRRRAVGLHLRGFTSTEIGRLLGWSEPKARNLTHRGLKDLRALLQTEGIGLP